MTQTLLDNTKFVAVLNQAQHVIGAYEVPVEYELKSKHEVFINEDMFAQWQLISTVQQAMTTKGTNHD